jgi:hypothetical protein
MIKGELKNPSLFKTTINTLDYVGITTTTPTPPIGSKYIE